MTIKPHFKAFLKTPQMSPWIYSRVS